MEQGQLTTFEGPYEWARIKWGEIQSKQEIGEIIAEKVKIVQPTKKQDKEQKIEDKISAIEEEISILKEKMEIESDWEIYEKLLESIRSNEQKLEILMMEWLEYEG